MDGILRSRPSEIERRRWLYQQTVRRDPGQGRQNEYLNNRKRRYIISKGILYRFILNSHFIL
jgi:hypothetical protein